MKWLVLMVCVSAALLANGALPSTGTGSSFLQGGDTAKSVDKSGKDWVQLFNGKDLTGWKTHPKSPGKWEVKDGAIVSGGSEISHLFSERGDYENFHFRIEAKISDKGNSGQYFRTKFEKGYPPGYEAQINSTHSDPVRTGSLYNMVKINEKLVEADTWFTQEVIADGNHIQIIVNGKKIVDYIDKKNTHTKGHFAIQQHDPMKVGGKVIESKVSVRKAEVKELPPTKK